MAVQVSSQLPAQDQIESSDQPSPTPLPAPIRTLRDPRTGPNSVAEKYPLIVTGADRTHFAAIASKIWQVATIVIPILLTVWLTHVSSSSEDRVKVKIDQQMDQQKQVFAEHVQLSQDLYKRRFETYDKLYAQLISLDEAIAQLDAGSTPVLWNRHLRNSLVELDSMRRANRLHLSDPVDQSMADAWQRGVRKNGAEFKQGLTQVELQMKSELRDLMAREPETRKNDAAAKPVDSSPKN